MCRYLLGYLLGVSQGHPRDLLIDITDLIHSKASSGAELELPASYHPHAWSSSTLKYI